MSHKLVETYVEERRAENASAKKVREDLTKNWVIEAWNCSEMSSHELLESMCSTEVMS